MAEKGDSGTIQKQVCVRVIRISAKTVEPHLDFGAVARAGAQSTQLYEIEKEVNKAYQK